MIRVVARSIVKEGKAEEFRSLASRLSAETNREKGCVSYALYQDVQNERAFSFIEEWADMETLQAHMKTSHFMEIVPLLGALQEGDSSVNIYRPA